MGRRFIEVMQVLVDRIHQGGYTQRALEDDIYAESQKRIAAEKDRDHWKQARQDAHEAGELMRAEIERLQAFVNLSRRLLTGSINYVEVDRLRAGLAELDAGTEPTPVAEPARCPECVKLRAFVGRVRELLQIPLDQIRYDDMAIMRAELAALDAEGGACPGK